MESCSDEKDLWDYVVKIPKSFSDQLTGWEDLFTDDNFHNAEY